MDSQSWAKRSMAEFNYRSQYRTGGRSALSREVCACLPERTPTEWRRLKRFKCDDSNRRTNELSTEVTPVVAAAPPRLCRALTLWDLILYGMIVLQPVAPMSAFGALSDRGRGHVVTAILVAMVAMLFTAISYGRMAQVYPSAGSAFTYVAREIHPSMGYVTGWSMVMDYIVNPLICTIWCAGQAHVFAPGLPRSEEHTSELQSRRELVCRLLLE